MIKVYAATDVGKVRATNEDSQAVFAPSVYVVADGMGGEAAGEVASRLLTETVKSILANKIHIDESELQQAILSANQKILQCANNEPHYHGMGTTASMLHIDDLARSACWAHVGDSRIYVLHDGDNRMIQITRDHSYVESLVEQGSITAEEAKVHPRRNMLLRAVGVEEGLQVDTGSLTVRAEDIFLLATDGLMKLISDSKIVAILQSHCTNPAQALVTAALEAGGADNVTVIVVVCD